jgi:hypothetical protein
LTGYISKGIALCGKGSVRHARAAFDVASFFTNQDSKTNHHLFLIKVGRILLAFSLLHCVFQAIALFNADQHEEAMLLVKELSAACPNVDPLGCRVVEVSIIQARSIIKTDLCNSHIRHIYVFSSELKHWTVRIMTKPLITSLTPPTRALPHRKPFIKHSGNSPWYVKMVYTDLFHKWALLCPALRLGPRVPVSYNTPETVPDIPLCR